ncbi:MAG: hypothetical protein ACK474_07870 [Pseudanabaena sp.]
MVAVVAAVVADVGVDGVLLQAPANIPTSATTHKRFIETIEAARLEIIPMNYFCI